MKEFKQEELETLEKLRISAEEQAAFFERNRPALKELAKFRMAKQLKKRVDGSDVIQDAFVKYCKDLKRYLDDPRIPPVMWLRRLVRQVIFCANRTHLTTKCRDLRREIPIGGCVKVNLDDLAGSVSSVGSILGKTELCEGVRKLLQLMSPNEREILSLVHFETMTIKQAAQQIGIGFEAAKKRYWRSLQRLRRLHESQAKLSL